MWKLDSESKVVQWIKVGVIKKNEEWMKLELSFTADLSCTIQITLTLLLSFTLQL